MYAPLVYILSVLVSVAFITLMEQKILASQQIRLGPSATSGAGYLQSVADAVKLLTKEVVKLWQISYTPFFVSPLISLSISLIMWLALPLHGGGVELKHSSLFFICLSGFSVYPVIFSGWTSNCKYSLLGSFRSVAQMISYEISLSFVLLTFMAFFLSTSVFDFSPDSSELMTLYLFNPLILITLACLLAETHRTPFDFSESESELVSGYNTEFGGGGFTLLFMAEYSTIMFMSMFTSFLFFSHTGLSLLTIYVGVFFMFLFVWVRGALPRARFDLLMHMAWSILLPTTLAFYTYILLFSSMSSLS